MSWVKEFVIGGLATSRLTRLVVEDSISQPLRDAALRADPQLGELVHCSRCTSVWAAAVSVVLVRRAPRLALMLGMSEVAILIRELVDGD